MFYLIPVLLFLTNEVHAQIAAASLFKDMQAENPAVVTMRPAATFSLQARQDTVTKEQVVDTGSSESDISITTTSLFYGGKGGGLTTEIVAESSSGTKEDTVTNGAATSEVKQESSITSLGAKVGLLGFLGLGYQMVSESREQSGSETGEYETSISIVTAGVQFSPGIDIGLFYQATTFEQDSTFEGSDTSTSFDMPRAGVGLGYTGSNFRIEAGYIMSMADIEIDQGGGGGAGENVVTYSPTKTIVSIEGKIKGISVGFTSSIYTDGYFDYNNLMFYTMVLANNQETRVENKFNVSFGSDKGHSFSGSYSVSEVESEELPPTLASGTKYATTTKISTIGVSYAYAF